MCIRDIKTYFYFECFWLIAKNFNSVEDFWLKSLIFTTNSSNWWPIDFTIYEQTRG